MNIIQNIKSHLVAVGVNDNFFQFYTQANNFKLKFFAPTVSAVIIPWVLYCIFALGIQPESFNQWLLFLGVVGFAQPLIITLFLSYMVPMNGWFFKTISSFWSSNRILKSFIDSTDYQDNILSQLFDDKSFQKSLLEFYSLINSINFATSYAHNQVNYANKEIKNHLDKLTRIIEQNNKEKFIYFFKSHFISDFSTYSQHDKVIEVLKMTGNLSQEEQNLPGYNPGDDLLSAMKEEINLRNKFKKVL